MTEDRFKKFADIGFEDFRRMARDESLSQYEKISFPDEYRKESEGTIFEGVLSKLDRLIGSITNRRVVLCYSLLRHVFAESPLVRVLDRSLELLSRGGQMLMAIFQNVLRLLQNATFCAVGLLNELRLRKLDRSMRS